MTLPSALRAATIAKSELPSTDIEARAENSPSALITWNSGRVPLNSPGSPRSASNPNRPRESAAEGREQFDRGRIMTGEGIEMEK